MAYDPNNIFARILRGEIPCRKIYEDDYALAFHDINPQTKASDAEIAGLIRAVGEVARKLGIAESGYRILANAGPDSRQEVPHLHIHIFGGQDLGRMIAPPGR